MKYIVPRIEIRMTVIYLGILQWMYWPECAVVKIMTIETGM